MTLNYDFSNFRIPFCSEYRIFENLEAAMRELVSILERIETDVAHERKGDSNLSDEVVSYHLEIVRAEADYYAKKRLLRGQYDLEKQLQYVLGSLTDFPRRFEFLGTESTVRKIDEIQSKILEAKRELWAIRDEIAKEKLDM